MKIEHPTNREAVDLLKKKLAKKNRKPPKGSELISIEDLDYESEQLEEGTVDDIDFVGCFTGNRVYYLHRIEGEDGLYQATVKWIPSELVLRFNRLVEDEIDNYSKDPGFLANYPLEEKTNHENQSWFSLVRRLALQIFLTVQIAAGPDVYQDDSERKKTTANGRMLDLAHRSVVIDQSEMPRKVKTQELEQKLKTEFDSAILESEELRKDAIAKLVESLNMVMQMPEELKTEALSQIDRHHLDEFNKDIESTNRRYFHGFVFGSLDVKPTLRRAQKWLADFYGKNLGETEKKDVVGAIQWVKAENQISTVFKVSTARVNCRVGIAYNNVINASLFRIRETGENNTVIKASTKLPDALIFTKR